MSPSSLSWGELCRTHLKTRVGNSRRITDIPKKACWEQKSFTKITRLQSFPKALSDELLGKEYGIPDKSSFEWPKKNVYNISCIIEHFYQAWAVFVGSERGEGILLMVGWPPWQLLMYPRCIKGTKTLLRREYCCYEQQQTIENIALLCPFMIVQIYKILGKLHSRRG